MYYFEILRILTDNKPNGLTSLEIFLEIRKSNPHANKLRTREVLRKMFLHNKNVYRDVIKRSNGREYVYFLRD